MSIYEVTINYSQAPKRYKCGKHGLFDTYLAVHVNHIEKKYCNVCYAEMINENCFPVTEVTE